MRHWTSVTSAEAAKMEAEEINATIQLPMNMEGEVCPWPWEPQQLKGAPMGMYHCSYCGSMEVAGYPHSDFVDQAGLDAFWVDFERELRYAGIDLDYEQDLARAENEGMVDSGRHVE